MLGRLSTHILSTILVCLYIIEPSLILPIRARFPKDFRVRQGGLLHYTMVKFYGRD